MLRFVSIVCVLGAVTAAPSYIGQGIAVGSVSNPSYGFNYAVSDPLTGDNKAQTEQREGGVVKGSYSLAEPDGTIRVVNYNADPVTGFNAVVKRIGPAAHPQQLSFAPIATPVIEAPIVSKAIAAPIAVGQSLVGLGALDLGLKGGYGLGALDFGLKGGYGLGALDYGLKGGLDLSGLGLGLKSGLELGGLGLKGGIELGGLGLGLKGGLELGPNSLGGLSLDAGLWKH